MARRAAAPADPGGRVRTDPDSSPKRSRRSAIRVVAGPRPWAGLAWWSATASTGTQEAAIARMRLVGAAEWPYWLLLIPSVRRNRRSDLGRHALHRCRRPWPPAPPSPRTAPLITIDGRRYIDGALRAGTNVDLAGDAGVGEFGI